jgi:uncharacterized protein YodC (DUF2158 family)
MTKANEISVGDVVKLNGSSTKMTVQSIDVATSEVDARWFNDADDLLVGTFEPSELVVVKKADAE